MELEPLPLAHLYEPTPYFFNRELSWLRFNERVLEEAADRQHPLLERLKFLAIFASNLDEFFMVRVAGLKEQVSAEIVEPTPDGMTPQEQLRAIGHLTQTLVARHADLLTQDVLPKLRAKGAALVAYNRLEAEQQAQLAAYFHDKVFPILTPLAIDPAHPIPKLRGLGLNLLVELKSMRDNGSGVKIAVVPVPQLLPRFYHFAPGNDPDARHEFVLVEQIIAEHIASLFPNLRILDIEPFRVTRNADLDIAEAEADDLLKLIERELRKRRLGTIIRLEVSEKMSPDHVQFLRDAFELQDNDVYRIQGPLGVDSFFQWMGAVDNRALKDEPFTPALHPRIARAGSIFDAVREQDILLHHPYDSFHPVVQLIEEAARDPHVLAIKQTLYRPSGRSAIGAALREAAMAGKQVTALIELKARFDEETNITWARELERVGVNVVYGMLGLKIHGKMVLILRQEADGLRHYVHLSSGNYNERTAQVYTDFGLLTCNRDIGLDISELFNLLTGYSQQETWRQILVAPVTMRQEFLKRIHRCIEAHAPERPSRIRLVMNSLVDLDMIQALYAASQHGVQVDAVVRGICCLVPGVPGVSEHIRVRSIVGRFLEHSRVYSFEYGNQTEIFLGSADWMPRNLNRRIEVAFPVLDQQLRTQVMDTLQVLFQDNQKARILQPDGTYTRPDPQHIAKEQRLSAQDYLLNQARQRQRLIDTTKAE